MSMDKAVRKVQVQINDNFDKFSEVLQVTELTKIARLSKIQRDFEMIGAEKKEMELHMVVSRTRMEIVRIGTAATGANAG